MRIKTNVNTVFIEPRNVFDSCIIRYDKKQECLIYDYCKLIAGFISLGMTEMEAQDHISYNLIGMQINKYFPYIEENTHE